MSFRYTMSDVRYTAVGWQAPSANLGMANSDFEFPTEVTDIYPAIGQSYILHRTPYIPPSGVFGEKRVYPLRPHTRLCPDSVPGRMG